MSGNVETPIETGQKVTLSKQNIDDKHHNFTYLSSTYFNSLQLCQSQTEKEIEDEMEGVIFVPCTPESKLRDSLQK